MTGWRVGSCCERSCPMTMVTSIGGGLTLCWMHYLLWRLPITPDLDVRRRTR